MSVKGDMVKAQIKNMRYLLDHWDELSDQDKKETVMRMHNAFTYYSWNI